MLLRKDIQHTKLTTPYEAMQGKARQDQTGQDKQGKLLGRKIAFVDIILRDAAQARRNKYGFETASTAKSTQVKRAPYK